MQFYYLISKALTSFCKDKIKKTLRNNIIYNVNCKNCEVSYHVGQTKHNFEIRKSEHQRQKSSVIFKHCNAEP